MYGFKISLDSLNAFLDPIVCSGISLTLDRSSDIFYSVFFLVLQLIRISSFSKFENSLFLFLVSGIFLILNFAINLALSLILILNVGWMVANGWTTQGAKDDRHVV